MIATERVRSDVSSNETIRLRLRSVDVERSIAVGSPLGAHWQSYAPHQLPRVSFHCDDAKALVVRLAVGGDVMLDVATDKLIRFEAV